MAPEADLDTLILDRGKRQTRSALHGHRPSLRQLLGAAAREVTGP